MSIWCMVKGGRGGAGQEPHTPGYSQGATTRYSHKIANYWNLNKNQNSNSERKMQDIQGTDHDHYV